MPVSAGGASGRFRFFSVLTGARACTVGRCCWRLVTSNPSAPPLRSSRDRSSPRHYRCGAQAQLSNKPLHADARTATLTFASAPCRVLGLRSTTLVSFPSYWPVASAAAGEWQGVGQTPPRVRPDHTGHASIVSKGSPLGRTMRLWQHLPRHRLSLASLSLSS